MLAVAWSHWERPYQFGVPFGAGVHLFYVLSGFLITGILLRVREQGDRGAALRVFYLRRSLRIFPAFYLTLLLASLADLPLVRASVAWHAAYLSNVYTFARGEWPGMIGHFWSLAVEEQFYLGVAVADRLRAAALAGAGNRGRHSSGASLSLVACRARLHRVDARRTHPRLPRLTWRGRADGGVGRGRPALAHPPRRTPVGWSSGWLGALALEQVGLRLPLVVAAKQTLQACVFAWIVLRAAEGFGGTTGRLLSARPVVYTGRISYGLYLADGFAGAMASALFIALGSPWPPPEPLRLVVLSALTLIVAAASWHLIERPFMTLKPRPTDSRTRSQHPTDN